MRFLLIFILAATACATSAHVVPYGQFQPRNQRAVVLLEEPDCDYTTIGVITVPKRPDLTTQQVLNDLGEEAAQYGGDAVVGFSQKDWASQQSFSGTVIRFVESDCRR